MTRQTQASITMVLVTEPHNGWWTTKLTVSLLLVICLLVLLFAVSVVGCLLGYSSCLVVWIPLFLDPSDGAFGRFDLAALCGCRTLNFCLFCFDK